MANQHGSTSPTSTMATEQALREYLRQQRFKTGSLGITGPFDIQPLKGGSTNFTYRIISQSGKDQAKDGSRSTREGNTAVLKYAAEYATMSPDVPLSSDRQLFEASAMRDLAPIIYANSEATCVRLPKLLFHDQAHHVIVMEDVGNASQEVAHLSRVVKLDELCKSSTSSPEDVRLAEQIGHQLGMFVYGLHRLGVDGRQEARQLKGIFLGNVAGRQIDVDTTFGDILDQLRVFRVDLSSTELQSLEGVIHAMSAEMMKNLETIIMGDLWYGNVMAKLSLSAETEALENVHILDWEFATCGPAFVDLAHFASEVWLQDRFGTTDSPAFNANRRAAISLFNSYRACGGSIDHQKVIYYIGGHICCFLGYTNWTSDDEIRKQVAREGVDLILHAHAENWSAIKENKFLEELLGL